MGAPKLATDVVASHHTTLTLTPIHDHLIDGDGIIRFRYAGELNQQVWQQQFLPLIQQVMQQQQVVENQVWRSALKIGDGDK